MLNCSFSYPLKLCILLCLISVTALIPASVTSLDVIYMLGVKQPDNIHCREEL